MQTSICPWLAACQPGRASSLTRQRWSFHCGPIRSIVVGEVQAGRASGREDAVQPKGSRNPEPGDIHATNDFTVLGLVPMALATSTADAQTAAPPPGTHGCRECRRSRVDSGAQGHGRVPADTEALSGVDRTDRRARSGRWPKAAAHGDGGHGRRASEQAARPDAQRPFRARACSTTARRSRSIRRRKSITRRSNSPTRSAS